MQIFDRDAIRFRRNRFANKYKEHNFLITEISKLVIERLYGNCGVTLNVGGDSEQFLKCCSQFQYVVHGDISEELLKNLNGTIKVVLDEEFLPFQQESFDTVVSVSALHRVNDLPGALLQFRYALKNNGVFIGTLFGVKTLYELRQSVAKFGLKSGVISPKIYPFVDVKDAGMLMQRAGFNMAVSDVVTIVMNYGCVQQLFRDLRYTGETNSLIKRNKRLMTNTEYNFIIQQYMEDFADEDGLIPATFDIVIITGKRCVG